MGAVQEAVRFVKHKLQSFTNSHSRKEQDETLYLKELRPFPFERQEKPFGIKLVTKFCLGKTCKSYLLCVKENLCLLSCEGNSISKCKGGMLRLDTNEESS